MFFLHRATDEVEESEFGDPEFEEHGLEVEDGAEAPVWEASDLPRDLASDLLPLQVAARPSPKDVPSCTPRAILPEALVKDHPEINFPPSMPRRRLKEKGMPDAVLGQILGRLQEDVNGALEPWQASWKLRRNAYHEYELDASETLGLSRKSLRQPMQEHWANASIEIKDRWAFVRAVRERLYNFERNGSVLRRTRIEYPTGREPPQIGVVQAPMAATKAAVIGKGLGMLRTFNTKWHNEVPELSKIMSQNTPLQQRIVALQNLTFLQDKYRQYKESVRSHARKHGMRSWGCCMEVSLRAEEVGRVHLHDYIGPALDFWGWDESKPVVEFREEDRWWNGLRAFSNITSARGNVNHRKLRAVAWGLYYVSGAKNGSIFSDGCPRPFEDLACTSRTRSQIIIRRLQFD